MKKDATPTITRESDKFMLRLPDGMRPRIAEEAKNNSRSMNAEIVACLSRSYSPPSEHEVEEITTEMFRDLDSRGKAMLIAVYRAINEHQPSQPIDNGEEIGILPNLTPKSQLKKK